jgi:hypothetical protein
MEFHAFPSSNPFTLGAAILALLNAKNEQSSCRVAFSAIGFPSGETTMELPINSRGECS